MLMIHFDEHIAGAFW